MQLGLRHIIQMKKTKNLLSSLKVRTFSFYEGISAFIYPLPFLFIPKHEAKCLINIKKKEKDFSSSLLSPYLNLLHFN